jgi:hypothetical protein
MAADRTGVRNLGRCARILLLLAMSLPALVQTPPAAPKAVRLGRVDGIGFADLMPGSDHGPGGWSDAAQFEVFGKPVDRTPVQSSP